MAKYTVRDTRTGKIIRKTEYGTKIKDVKLRSRAKKVKKYIKSEQVSEAEARARAKQELELIARQERIKEQIAKEKVTEELARKRAKEELKTVAKREEVKTQLINQAKLFKLQLQIKAKEKALRDLEVKQALKWKPSDPEEIKKGIAAGKEALKKKKEELKTFMKDKKYKTITLEEIKKKTDKERLPAVNKVLKDYQNYLINEPTGLSAAAKESRRKKFLDKLEKKSNLIIADNVKDSFIAGLGVGTAQILRDPAKYKAQEDVQDAIDLINKPTQTLSDTYATIKENPAKYGGEIAAEIIWLGAAEQTLKKGFSTSKKFLAGAKKELKKKFGGKKIIKKVGSKLIPYYGQASTVKDVYDIIRAGYIATIPIKKGETKKEYNNRIDSLASKKLNKTNVKNILGVKETKNNKQIIAGLNKNIKSLKQTLKTRQAKAKEDIKKSKEKLKKQKKEVKKAKKGVKAAVKKAKKKPTVKAKAKVIRKKAKLTAKQKLKLKEKQKLKEKLKQKQKQKQKLKQKLKQKKKLKQKLKEKQKQKLKEKQKLKQKQKEKQKLKLKLKKKPVTKKKLKAKVSLSLDKAKPKKKKTVTAAKKKAEKHLLLTKGLQKAKITSNKKIKKVTKKKKGIKYTLSKNKKTLKLTEIKPKTKKLKAKIKKVKPKPIKKVKKSSKIKSKAIKVKKTTRRPKKRVIKKTKTIKRSKSKK